MLIIPSLSTTLHGKVVLRDVRDKFGKASLQVGVTCTPKAVADMYSEYLLLSLRNEQQLTFGELNVPKDFHGKAIGAIYRGSGDLHAHVTEDLAVGSQP